MDAKFLEDSAQPDLPEPRANGEDDDEGEVAVEADQTGNGGSMAGAPSDFPAHNGRQTGVKGVRDDYRAYQRLQRELRRHELQSYVERAKQKSMICKDDYDEINRPEAEEEQQDSDDDFGINDSELMDDEFTRKYLEQRKKEMVSKRCHFSMSPTKLMDSFGFASASATFGVFREIGVQEFVNAVEKVPANVKVVVHLYENSVQDCAVLNEIFGALAKAYVHTKFIRMQARLAPSKFDESVLPTVLVYQSGDLIHNLVKITMELNDDLTLERVESLLIRLRVLDKGDKVQAKK